MVEDHFRNDQKVSLSFIRICACQSNMALTHTEKGGWCRRLRCVYVSVFDVLKPMRLLYIWSVCHSIRFLFCPSVSTSQLSGVCVCVWAVHTRACEAHRELCSFGCCCMMDIWKLNWLMAPPSQQPAGRPLAEQSVCVSVWWGSQLEWWGGSTSGQPSCHRQPPLLDI